MIHHACSTGLFPLVANRDSVTRRVGTGYFWQLAVQQSKDVCISPWIAAEGFICSNQERGGIPPWNMRQPLHQTLAESSIRNQFGGL